MLSDLAYWSVVAKSIDVEDEKIEIFLTHNPSRGIAREAILRSLLVGHTRHPFVISTGFVYDTYPNAPPSKQCDVLVYDPRDGQPYYRLNEFVVVPPRAARVAVEVKSKMNHDEFKDLAKARRSFCRSMLGFAFDGPTFETFCDYVAEEVRTGLENNLRQGLEAMPECIAVHRKNYLGVRATSWSKSTGNNCYLLIDFSKLPEPSQGTATAGFMRLYDEILTNERIHDGHLHMWFNTIPSGARVLIDPNGNLQRGGEAKG